MDYIHEHIGAKDGLIKGRIAESLVRELFLILGMEVCAYGIEYQSQMVATLHRKRKIENSIALQHLRNHPDFLICNDSDHHDLAKIYRVEVKFRSNGMIYHDHIKEYDDDVIFIFLDQITFYVARKDQLTADITKMTDLPKLAQDGQEGRDSPIFDLTPKQRKQVYEFSRYVSLYLSNQIVEDINTDAPSHINQDDLPENNTTPAPIVTIPQTPPPLKTNIMRNTIRKIFRR